MRQPGSFDLGDRYRLLSENSDPLVRLAALIDFEVFRPRLAAALGRSDGSKGGHPPYDPVLMFRIRVLQTLYTLSVTPPSARSATGYRSCASGEWGSPIRCRTPRRCGCSANS